MKSEKKLSSRKPHNKLFLVFVMFCMVLFSVNLINAALTDSLISYLKLDETTGTVVVDSVQTKNFTKTITGTGNITFGSEGKFNTGFLWSNGTQSYLNRSAVSQLQTNWSVSFWAKLMNTNIAGELIRFGDASPSAFDLSLNATNGLYSSIYSGGWRTVYTTTTLTNNTWYHILVTSNTTGTNYFVNGVNVGTTTYYANVASLTNYIGGYISGGPSAKVIIDEVGYWNRTLTTSEITSLYNSGSGTPIFPSYLINYDINLTTPSDGSLLTDIGYVFNATYNISGSSTNHVWKNATYNLYKNGDLFNSTTVTLTTNRTNSSLYIDNFVIGNYIWFIRACYGNATYNNCTTSSNYTYTVGASFTNLTYENSVYETQYQTITGILNLVPGTEIYDVKLVYNGVEYTGSYSNNGDDTYLLSASFDTGTLPSSTTTNLSYYLKLIYSVGSSFIYENTSSQNQTVNPLSLFGCNSALNRTLNFTAQNEENLTTLSTWNFLATFQYWIGNGNIKKNVSINNLSINSAALCINPNNLTYKTDAIIQYEKTGFVKRNYYLYNASLTNTTQNITLYLLESSASTSFIISVKDGSQLPITDAYVYVQRYYPGTGLFQTVAMSKTDGNGNTVAHFEAETEDYRILVMKDGIIVYTSPIQKVYCSATPCTLPIQIESAGVSGWTHVGNLTNLIYYGPTYNNVTGLISYTYIDTSGTTSYGRLWVYTINAASGKQTICNVSSTSNAATLTCDVENITGTVYAQGYISRSPEVLVWAVSFIVNTVKAIMGIEGLFWAFIVIMVLAIGGAIIGGVSGMIIGSILGFIGAAWLGIASFGTITIFGLIILGVFIIWRIKN